MSKVALITGITGQDGSYLAEYLLKQGYIVHGIKRRSSQLNTQRLDHLYEDRHLQSAKMFLHYGDLTDCSSLLNIIHKVNPDEIYNLGAMSHVHVSFEMPNYTTQVIAMGTINLLEIIKSYNNKIRFYQASTSELFGNSIEMPQNESTPFNPRSPYAVAKHFAYSITSNYREAYGIYACNGILFNHESPRRGETFLTRKVSIGVAKIALNKQKILYLGNLDATRDWGHAKDYIKAMHLMLQQESPEDYVIATGISTKVRDFLQKSFAACGINIVFDGQGLYEKAYINNIDNDLFTKITGMSSSHLIHGQAVVEVKEEFFRPTEVNNLLGDPSKAIRNLCWKPEITLDELVNEMVVEDVKLLMKCSNNE